MTDREVIIGILETLSEDLEDTNRREQKHCLDLAIRMLKAERPKGKWIMNKTSARGRNYTCTKCEKVSRNKFHFCPNCGADMREADNDKTN